MILELFKCLDYNDYRLRRALVLSAGRNITTISGNGEENKVDLFVSHGSNQ